MGLVLSRKQIRGGIPLFIISSLALIFSLMFFCLGPLYVRSLETVAFSRSLDALRNNLHPQIVSSFAPISQVTYETQREIVYDAGNKSFGGALLAHEVHVTTPIKSTVIERKQNLDASSIFQYRSGYDSKIEVKDGSLPQSYNAGYLEVAIGLRAAEKLGLTVGDSMRVTITNDSELEIIDTVITGVVEPIDIENSFWVGQGMESFETQLIGNRWLMRFFISESELFWISQKFPSLLGTVNDILYLDPDELLETGADKTYENALLFSSLLDQKKPGADLFMGLLNDVKEFKVDFPIISIPLVIVFGLVSFIAAYIFFMMGLLFRDMNFNSVILLKSRGSGLSSTMSSSFLTTVLVGGIGVVAAPKLAQLAMMQLSNTAILSHLDLKDVVAEFNLFLLLPWSLIGFITAMILILLPSMNQLNSELISTEHSRSTYANPFWWQRYFFDLWIVVWSVLLLSQFFNRQLEEPDTYQGDISFFLMPFAIILIAILMFYRLLPIVSRLLSLALKKSNLLSFKLAADGMSRSPLDSAVLGALLMLVSLGAAFLASFGGTLQLNEIEAASFQTGGDVRIIRPGGFERKSFSELSFDYEKLDIVQSVSPTYRSMAGTGSSKIGTVVPILGIDVNSIGQVLSQNLSSDGSLSSDIGMINMTPLSGVSKKVIEQDIESLGLWVKPERGKGNRFLWLHITDGNGFSHIYSMGALNFYEWKELKVDVSKSSHDPPPLPYTLDSILIYENVYGSTGSPGSMLVDDLSAYQEDGTILKLDEFDTFQDWLPVLTSGNSLDILFNEIDDDRGNVVRYKWDRGTIKGVRGIYVSPKYREIPSLVTPSFLSLKGINIGDSTTLYIGGRVVPILIIGVLDKFATMNPNPDGFVVLDGESLFGHLNVINTDPYIWPNEIILNVNDSNAAQILNEFMEIRPDLQGEIISKEELIQSSENNPMESAGWKGVAFLGLVYSLFLLVLGSVTYSLFTLRQRIQEIALLKALGFTTVRATVLFSIDYILTILVAIPFGTAVGLLLSHLLVPFFSKMAIQEASPYYSVYVDTKVIILFLVAIFISLIFYSIFLFILQKRKTVSSILRLR